MAFLPGPFTIVGGFLSGLAERRACHFAPSFIVAILGIEAAAMSEERPPEAFHQLERRYRARIVP